MDKLQRKIGEWGKETFKHDVSHLSALFIHMVKEMEELNDALTVYDLSMYDDKSKELVAEECADILILMCSIAHLCGFSLKEAVQLKMGVNRSRTWGEPDKDGVIEHE